jgi:predicted metal-dependent phosphoesterase TrpH
MEETGAATRCDLHVHSIHSGVVDLPFLGRFGNECYSEPREVYELARRRGMDLVTLTDHDSIEGALEIAALPGTFISEEVTCELPGGRVLHLGVFDITEWQHQRIARLRHDAEALFAHLAEECIPACVNHPFSALTGRRETSDFGLPLRSLSLIEARNGMMSFRTNAFAAIAGGVAGMAAVGGSDAHTLASVARAYTVVRGATTREQFLEGLRRGRTIPAGGHGSYARLTADVVRIFRHAYADNARRALGEPATAVRFALMLAAAPILPLIPFVTAAIYADEVLFATRHFRRFQKADVRQVRTPEARGPFGAAPAATAVG